ncbi:HAD family phosphatase [Oscillatoria sp. FACHB-1407]|uniref:HAD family hydrolase n=1 Tax=Oscillatoria sp. FACHB-1407 TaxID=2692847 RepID=UPI00168A3E28|nr:HAD family phosphatase [Oscillatoria sp. FACHB-1407]MBD2463247.1 HAD family phosphatase [Oscillatoria sp. FACHB-1407]
MLKAVLFDFNGVIINDEPLHQKLIDQLLIEENLRPKPEEYWQVCVGRSDRACLTDLLARRGRIVTDKYLDELIARKSRAYQQQLEVIEKLPIYPGLADLIFQLRSAQIKMAVVSGAMRAEIELVLERSQLSQHFAAIVAGDEITQSKPEPEGYLLAIKRLNQQFPDLLLQPNECLAIEDTFAGIEAAKRAGIQVVGVANTYPFHMMQRRANWAVDYLTELELDRIRDRFSGTKSRQTVS